MQAKRLPDIDTERGPGRPVAVEGIFPAYS